MNKIEKVLYTARAHTTGGRDDGASRTDDGRLQVTLSRPGSSGSGTNPEQLFAAGWSACFLSAIKLIAGKKKIALPAEVVVDAEVDLGTTHGGVGLAAQAEREHPGHGPGSGPVSGRSRESRVSVLVSHQRQHRGEVQRECSRTCRSRQGNTARLKLASRAHSWRVCHVHPIWFEALIRRIRWLSWKSVIKQLKATVP